MRRLIINSRVATFSRADGRHLRSISVGVPACPPANELYVAELLNRRAQKHTLR